MYQSTPSAVESSLESSGSKAFTNPDVVNTIIALTDGDGTIGIDQVTVAGGGTVTVPAGTEIVFIQGSDTVQTQLTPPGDAPVIVFQGSGGVDVVINSGAAGDAGSDADRVVVGTKGNDKIVIADGKDTLIVAGSGNSTITGGSGDDTIVAGLGNTTIDGGAGHNVVELSGPVSNYTITVVAGEDRVIVTDKTTGKTTDIHGAQYVQLQGTDALILSTDTVQAGVADLYQATFGRTGEHQGIEYWFELAKQGYSLNQIAHGFTLSPEFAAIAAKTDSQFIFDLYSNTFGRAADSAGVDYWLAQMANGLSRADVLSGFATAAALNDAGVITTEVTVVGSVTIVPHIV